MANHHGEGDLYTAALCSPGHKRQKGDRFGRMFPDLPPLYLKPEVLIKIGRVKGSMQATAEAKTTRTVPVGHVFFGQFIDHDITLDVQSSVSSVNVPSQITNARTPTLDLDCLYGAGPEAQPYMYEGPGPFEGVKLIVGGCGDTEGHDLPRHNGRALIGDFRNDENRIVSQIQVGLINVHNAFVEELLGDPAVDLDGHELFEEARRLTTWHYQWAVVHDFLVAMCGGPVVKDILGNGRNFFTPETSDPFMPVEFSVAAYRFGHSMAPLRIRVKKPAKAKKHDLFGPEGLGAFKPVAGLEQIVEFPAVFNVGRSVPQKAERCDAKLAALLLDLPFMPEDASPEEKSLATRNLRRGQSFLLPSGEQVAHHMDCSTAREIARVSEAAAEVHPELDGCTPLWLYCLLEGQVLGRGGIAKDKGEGLGPVGGRIVAEVVIGLLECDQRSWLASNRSWAPECDRDTIGALLEWGRRSLDVVDLTESKAGAHA